MSEQKWTLDRIINGLLYLGGLALMLWLIHYLRAYLLPFFLALVTAYILEPIVQFFQRALKLKGRGGAVFLTILVIMIFWTIVIAIVVPSVAVEFNKAEVIFSKYLDEHQTDTLLPADLQENIQSFLRSEEAKGIFTQENLSEYATQLFQFLLNSVSGTLGILLGIFTLVTYLMYLIFIMLSFSYFSLDWEKSIPEPYRDDAVMVITDLNREMQAYFRGQSLIVLCVAILFALGFKLIGLPMAILFGIFVGLLNYVPYLQNLGFIPAAFLGAMQAVETGQSIWVIYGLILLVFTVVQVIQDAYLTPKIMGDAIGLNPAVILLSLSIWGGLLGLVGMVIALPVTSVILSYYRRFILGRTG